MFSNKVLVTGCNGLLGATVCLLASEKHTVVASSHRVPYARESVETQCMDITNAEQVKQVIQQVYPDVIFHCAAETRVDFCEANPDIADEVNAKGTKNVALAAEACGAMLVYLSSDSVFDGNSGGYKETDQPNPSNVYSRTKLLGEEFVMQFCSRHLIVRTNMFGWNMKPKESLSEWILNNVRNGIQISGFTDVIFGPLIVNDLTDLLLKMYQEKLQGIYHVAASDSMSKYDFACEIAKVFDLNKDLIVPAKLASAEFLAPRPAKTHLNTNCIEEALGDRMPTVREGVTRFYELNEQGYVEQLKSLLKKTDKGNPT